GKKAIDRYGAAGGKFDPQRFEPEAAHIGDPTQCQQQLIPFHHLCLIAPAQLQPDGEIPIGCGQIVGSLGAPASE
ncbi:hypothetical protein, partial [Escherichia coli]|uniref:hypothetical protein n=1 Tax=Escherichia coli TaxID=562 RepID=UPI0026F8C946